MADRITRNFISITWWPLIILAESILLCQEVDSLPVAQGFLNTLGQMPSGIQYPGVFGLPGGETKSLVTDNFQPNEIVVGSGMTSHPLLTGVAGGIDFAARRVVSAGENIAGAASDLIQREYFVFV